MTNKVIDDAATDTTAIDELMGYDKWPDGVATEFDRALGVVVRGYLKNRRNLTASFATVIAEFRKIEAEFVGRVGDDIANVRQVQTIVSEFLLEAAYMTDQPFATCDQYWHDLQKLGFYRIERECMQTGFFAGVCLSHARIDVGLAVVDSIRVKLERLRAEPNATETAIEYYAEQIESFAKLRARLEEAQHAPSKI